MTKPTPAYFERFLPSDPINRSLFRILCDHIRTSLDPEVTKFCLRGTANFVVEDRHELEVAAAFLRTAACLDETRSHGVFYLGPMQWRWHFERETSSGGKPRKTEIGMPVLVIEC